LLVGECFIGDIIGCFRVLNLPNVYVQSVKNFEHGVGGYLHVRYDLRKVINGYLQSLILLKASGKLHCSGGFIFMNLVDSCDTGSLLEFKNIAVYLYLSEIVIQYKKTEPRRLMQKLVSLSKEVNDNTVKSYIYHCIARLFYMRPDSKKYLDSVYSWAKKGFYLNINSPQITSFLSDFAFRHKQAEECLFWSSMAITARRGGDIPCHSYSSNSCYAEHVEALARLGQYKAGVLFGEFYMKIKNLYKHVDYSLLETAVYGCKEKQND
jgi:hypothetical protein